MISLKYGTSEPIYKTETDSQTQKTDLLPRGRGDGDVLNWAIGIDMYTVMCIKLMTD